MLSALLMPALVPMVVVMLSASASAQSGISSDLTSAESLSEAQRQSVRDYVESMCSQLHEGEAPAVTEARKRLLEPMNMPAGTSAVFLELYTSELQPCLDEALDSDRMIVRLNGMIVATRMSAGAALPLVQKGVNDPNAAVRYWAIKCVREIGQADDRQWPTAMQEELLELLTPVLQEESVDAVVQQLMLAMVELDVPAAGRRTLEALNQRVTEHVQNPGRPIQAEQAGLGELFRKLQRELDNTSRSETEIQRELARTAYRYMRLAATELSEGNVPDKHLAGYKTVLTVADTILRTTYSDLGGSGSVPRRVTGDVQSGNWDGVLVKADRWEDMLQGAPFNFEAGQLTIQ